MQTLRKLTGKMGRGSPLAEPPKDARATPAFSDTAPDHQGSSSQTPIDAHKAKPPSAPYSKPPPSAPAKVAKLSAALSKGAGEEEERSPPAVGPCASAQPRPPVPLKLPSQPLPSPAPSPPSADLGEGELEEETLDKDDVRLKVTAGKPKGEAKPAPKAEGKMAITDPPPKLRAALEGLVEGCGGGSVTYRPHRQRPVPVADVVVPSRSQAYRLRSAIQALARSEGFPVPDFYIGRNEPPLKSTVCLVRGISDKESKKRVLQRQFHGATLLGKEAREDGLYDVRLKVPGNKCLATLLAFCATKGLQTETQEDGSA